MPQRVTDSTQQVGHFKPPSCTSVCVFMNGNEAHARKLPLGLHHAEGLGLLLQGLLHAALGQRELLI